MLASFISRKEFKPFSLSTSVGPFHRVMLSIQQHVSSFLSWTLFLRLTTQLSTDGSHFTRRRFELRNVCTYKFQTIVIYPNPTSPYNRYCHQRYRTQTLELKENQCHLSFLQVSVSQLNRGKFMIGFSYRRLAL